jgi:Spy/CpxP family protein refolding chaperone
MKTTRFAALGAALLIGMGATAQAQTTAPAPQPPAGAEAGRGHQGHGKDGMRGQRGMRGGRGQAGRALFRGIDLSETQKSQVKTIHEKYAQQRQAIWKPERGTDGRMQRPDSATRVQLQSLMEKQTAELRGVLTPAQQTTFDQNRAELRQRAEARMKDGRGRGGRTSR